MSPHFSSNSLLSHEGVEIQPDKNRKGASKRAGRAHQSSHNSPGLCRVLKSHLISFVKVCFSIIANYSSTVPESLQMLLCKHTCFNSKGHLASWRCHGVTATVTFQSFSRNHHLAECDSGVRQGKQGRMKLKFVFYCSDLFLDGFR